MGPEGHLVGHNQYLLLCGWFSTLKWLFLNIWFPWNCLPKILHQKPLSGSIPAAPEKRGHLVGPKVHLVGPCDILTIFSLGGMAYTNCLTYSCTYVKGNYNPYRSCWENFPLGCATSRFVNFVKKFKNLTTDIFVKNGQNWDNWVVLGHPHWGWCNLSI